MSVYFILIVLICILVFFLQDSFVCSWVSSGGMLTCSEILCCSCTFLSFPVFLFSFVLVSGFFSLGLFVALCAVAFEIYYL